MKIIAYQIDLARQKERIDYLKTLVDKAEKWGYNTIILYIECSIRTTVTTFLDKEDTYSRILPRLPGCKPTSIPLKTCSLVISASRQTTLWLLSWSRWLQCSISCCCCAMENLNSLSLAGASRSKWSVKAMPLRPCDTAYAMLSSTVVLASGENVLWV